jgi:DNA polymerase-3 subunit beta
MKFTILKEHFTNGLTQVQNVVPARPTMPILNNVLIEATGDQISLTTTNLDLGIRCTIKAIKVETEGSLTLPVKKLATIIKDLPGMEVEVEALDAEHAKITAGKSKFRMTAIGVSEFPPLSDFENDHEYSLDQDKLQLMLKSVSYAQSSDESRHMLNGVYFNFEENKLTTVATDGKRLALNGLDLEIPDDKTGNFILPMKTVHELERLLGKGDNVKILFNERQVAFSVDVGDDSAKSGFVQAIRLVSKTVEGKFPNYKIVIPENTEYSITMDRDDLRDCISRAALVVTEKSESINLTFHKNNLVISGQSTEFGESEEHFPIDYDGAETKLTFNPKYLISPLSVLVENEITFKYKDSGSPGLFSNNEHFMCVVMPLRFS